MPAVSCNSLVVRLLLVFCGTLFLPCVTQAQEDIVTDSLSRKTAVSETEIDSLLLQEPQLEPGYVDMIDTIMWDNSRPSRDWSTWRPDPKRAVWLAVVLPGAGQIYNRKYWKLPIIYGGIVGSVYAMQWNNQMYSDYSQAYLDITDSDPSTQSYNQFLHLGNKITDSNKERYKTLFKKRKDYYRRYRDLSFFVLVGVYALSVIDAYVDASLSEFDISKDLSMKVSPAVIHDQQGRNPLKSNALGLQCSIHF